MTDFIAALLKQEGNFVDSYEEKLKQPFQAEEKAEENEQTYYQDEQFAVVCNKKDTEINEQAYVFAEGRYTMAFNGKIYYKDSATYTADPSEEAALEYLAGLFLEKGTDMFKEINGMFAILIWDKQEKRLYGARDHFGVQPLYYMELEDELLFTTNRKYIPISENDIPFDSEALQHYLTYQFVPEPYTLAKNVRKLEPGYFFVKEYDQPMERKRYFNTNFQPVLTDKQMTMKKIREAVEEAVECRVSQEENIGSFLSGGIDSTIVAALAKQVKPDIKTFSVGFNEGLYSETEVARETAARLGLEHLSYTISAEEYIDNLPEIMRNLPDPLADPACVPLFFAAREAKKHVTGVLSGEGADEVFGGYNIYREPTDLKLFERIPTGLHGALRTISNLFPEGVKGKSFLKRGTTPLAERYIGNAKIFEENEKQQYLRRFDENICYQQITEKMFKEVANDEAVHQMQYIDFHTWLPGDILLKADRMTKAHDIQLHSPFLDKNVFELARHIPVHEKIANGTTKHILRETFQSLLPEDVLGRKKLGFPVPMRNWLKDEIYDWAKNLIFESDTDYLLHKDNVLALLDAHANEKGDYSRKLWTILVFMKWHQVHLENKPAVAVVS